MSPKRAAVYYGCSATLLAAWLASASGIVNQSVPSSAADPQPVQSTGTETLAEDVQAQAQRLRDRLASAPAPKQPARNPFSFAPKPTRARTVAAAVQPPAPTASVPAYPEPLLTLVGVAADQTPSGIARTAIITAEAGQMFMVKPGEFIGARYRVESVGADVVELLDLTNQSTRRLALR
jgi:hypothetical protein